MSDLQNTVFDDEHVEMLPARTQLTLLGLLGSSHDGGQHESHSSSETTTYTHESHSESSSSEDNSSGGHGHYGVQYGHGSGDDNSIVNGVNGTDGGINVAALNGTLNGFSILGGSIN